LEHILLRPDSYIGSIETEQQEVWVFNSELEVLEKKSIRYVPGLYKIVDEILVNAADNKVIMNNQSSIYLCIHKLPNM
jgi:DNA topoisomerase-2